MSRLLKSRDYLMKCLGFVLLLGFISLGAIGGCGNNGGEQDGTQALTESDFFNTLNLFANPEDGVVVSFLESTEAPEEDNLTGELGFDIIPYRYTRTLNHTFCFEDDNDDSIHFMILRDSDGEEVLRVLANEGCVTEVIESGDYEVVLTHGEHVDEQETIFLIPALEEEQVTKRDKFNQKGIKTANSISSEMHRYLPGELVKFFESISNVFTRPAIAQTPDDFTTLINTNACVKCDLRGANLSNAILSEANLSEANLSEANLSEAFLFGANLFSADLSNAILFRANLTETNLRFADLSNAILLEANLLIADLTGANLSNADLNEAILNTAILTGANLLSANLFSAELRDAFLIGANLSNAILSEADMTDADLSEANLSNADLSGANLSNATWCDGSCICAQNSIDTCVGCESIDICDGS